MRSPVITGKRVRLRPVRRSDGRSVATILSLPDVAHGLGNPPSQLTVGMAQDWIARRRRRLAQGELFALAITLPPRDTLIGVVSLRLRYEHRRAELSYWISPAHAGRGFAREAVAILVEWGFAELPIDRVYARHLGINRRSRRLLVALGFRLEGRLRNHHRMLGTSYDVEVRSRLRTRARGVGGAPPTEARQRRSRLPK